MTKPLSERIREAHQAAQDKYARRFASQTIVGEVSILDAQVTAAECRTYGFLAELADQQAEIKAMIEGKK